MAETHPGQSEAEAKWGPKLPPAVAAQVAAVDQHYQSDPNQPQPGDPPQPQPQPPGTPQPQPQPPQPAPEDPNAQTWEQRYRSSQGRLEAAQAALAAQNERLSNMETMLATMQATGSVQQPTSETQPARAYERLVTPEEENDYGKDLLQVVGKRAREEFIPEVETLRERLDRIEGRVDGASQVISRSQISDVYSLLHQNIGPTWTELNQYPDFKDRWLKEPDPYSGRVRGDMLKEAFDRRDGPRVLRFFQGYLSEAAPDTQNAQPHPPVNGAPNGAPPNGRVPLEAFAAPGRARSEPQGHLPPGKPTYSRAQLQAFWKDKREGKWRGREADADAIEQDIFRAQHEGRIV